MQKNRLAKKGENADIFFVTATPRTLQQAMYDSIECLVLRKKIRIQIINKNCYYKY